MGPERASYTAPKRPSRQVATCILRAMKLIVAVVHNEDAGALVDGLHDREFRATRLHSSGSFLKQSNATIIVGAEDDQVEPILEIVRATVHATDPDRQPDAADHGTRRVLHALPAGGRGGRGDGIRASGGALRATLSPELGQ